MAKITKTPIQDGYSIYLDGKYIGLVIKHGNPDPGFKTSNHPWKAVHTSGNRMYATTLKFGIFHLEECEKKLKTY